MHVLNFNGRSSSEFPFLLIQDLGKRQRGVQDIDLIEVPLANKALTVVHPTFQPYERTMLLHISDYSRINEIYSWLKGSGRLETSLDVGYFFQAYVSEFGEMERYSPATFQTSVTFVIDPSAYLLSGETTLVRTASGSINNPGTEIARPLYKVFGTSGAVTIKGQRMEFTDINEFLIVDVDKKIVYKDTLNQGDKMSGPFAVMHPGANSLTISGSITKIEIIPRWCDL